jgi:hypothetical protein
LAVLTDSVAYPLTAVTGPMVPTAFRRVVWEVDKAWQAPVDSSAQRACSLGIPAVG